MPFRDLYRRLLLCLAIRRAKKRRRAHICKIVPRRRSGVEFVAELPPGYEHARIYAYGEGEVIVLAVDKPSLHLVRDADGTQRFEPIISRP